MAGSQPRRNFLRGLFIRNISGWMIMIPSVILFSFFVWGPLLESIRLSLYHAKGIRVTEFVGLMNYKDVFIHPDFGAAVRNSFRYSLWSLIIGFLIPPFLAILINEIRGGKSAFKTCVYLPSVVPGVAIVLLWGFMFNPGNTGLLNILLGKIGVGPQPWLTNPRWTIPLIIITMTWRGAGASSMLYIAGLQGIDPELYEAAIIDGAGIFRRIRHITIPCIYNLARTIMILQVINVFQVLYEPLVMTDGGPNNASLSMMQLVYRFAFERYDYPKAAAVSVNISMILIILAVLYFKINKRKDM